VPVAGATAIVVDDGIATGGTARAAVEVVRAMGAARVIVAVPVAAAESIAGLEVVADDVVAVHSPVELGGVGSWYRDFRQTSDEEVIAILDGAG
jgi:predicted phosphoribosyltransferase